MASIRFISLGCYFRELECGLAEETLNWVQRRGKLEAHLPEAWNLLCISIEQNVESFGLTPYARERHLIATAKRINNCIHIARAPVSGPGLAIVIDVCLDRENLRVFSKTPDGDKGVLLFSADGQGKPQLRSVGAAHDLTDDEACEYFLKDFLFPARPTQP